ncbi:hypothetical protein C8R45DRAFT_944099 [Mycena sanguinolenta]|nr:hypothetical protein C8R45DRAFT_944099 [Mycena sanguinolenta]
MYIQGSSSDGSLALAGELAPSSSHRESRQQHLDNRQQHLDSSTTGHNIFSFIPHVRKKLSLIVHLSDEVVAQLFSVKNFECLDSTSGPMVVVDDFTLSCVIFSSQSQRTAQIKVVNLTIGIARSGKQTSAFIHHHRSLSEQIAVSSALHHVSMRVIRSAIKTREAFLLRSCGRTEFTSVYSRTGCAISHYNGFGRVIQRSVELLAEHAAFYSTTAGAPLIRPRRDAPLESTDAVVLRSHPATHRTQPMDALVFRKACRK